MAMVRVGDIVRHGQISDIPPFDLPPGALTLTYNVLCDDGGVRKVAGFTSRYDLDDPVVNPAGHPGAASPAGLPIWFENWFMNNTGQMMVLSESAPATPGAGRFFLLNNSGNFDEVTVPAAAAGADGTKWYSASFGQYVIWSERSSPPISYGPLSDPVAGLVVLPGWPDVDPDFPESWTARMVRPYRNFLIALDMTKDGVEQRNRIQWSDAADNTGLPPNWNETDPSSLAGGVFISGDDGAIIDAHQLNDSFVIYTEQGIWQLSLVGGAYTMQLRKVGHRGAVNRNCVIPFDNRHFVVAPGAFYVFDGNKITLVGEDQIVSTFFQRAVRLDNIHVSHFTALKKIAVSYQSEDDDEYATKLIVWDYRDNVWTESDVSDYPACKIQVGPSSELSVTWDSIEPAAQTPVGIRTLPPGVKWQDASTGWSDLEAPQGTLRTHLLSRTNHIYQIGGTYLRDGNTYTAFAERLYMDCDDLLGDQGGIRTQRVKHIKRMLPQMTGQGAVQFQVGQAMVPNGPITWQQAVDFEIGVDWKVDTRISGRYLCWRVTSKNTGQWNLTGFDLEVELAGER